MSTFAEYTQYDATGLAELLKKKKSPQVRFWNLPYLRLNAITLSINAVVHKQFERARSQIQSCDPDSAPLAGVPFLLKDLLGEDKGEPSTSSCPPMKDWTAPQDSELVRRFKQSGLQILGRTNTPQLGIYGVTESIFAVHVGIMELATHSGRIIWRFWRGCRRSYGTDRTRWRWWWFHSHSSGTLWIWPALKRLEGGSPPGPHRGERWNGLVSEGVLSRSVRDTALILDLASGMDVGAPYASPAPENFVSSQTAESAPRRRIAFTKRALFGTNTHPDNEAALMHTVKLLQDLGHTVEEACPEYDQERLTYAYYIVVSTGVGLGVRQMETKLGRKLRLEELEMSTWALEAISNAFSASEYSEQVDFIHRESRRVAQFFEQYDALLTPTAAKPPFPSGVSNCLKKTNYKFTSYVSSRCVA